jgi:hypothetical protein
VDIADIAPRLPTWDERAADELLLEVEGVRRLLDEVWPQLERAHLHAMGGWTGLAFARFEERYREIQQLVGELRADLSAVPGRVAGGSDAADDGRRRWALYQAGPAVGLAGDVLDWLGG